MLNYNVLNEYVEKMKKNKLPIVSTTNNIKALTSADINKLKAGDIVLKEDETGKHAYIVSYKKDGTGICMTYSDATYTETISYDCIEGEWIYNSQDSTELVSKSYVDSLMSGALKRTIVETLPTEDIDTNTIYMVLDSQSSQQGNVYNEYLYINNAWELIGTTQNSGEVWENQIIIKNSNNYYLSLFFNTKEEVTSSNATSIIETEGSGYRGMIEATPVLNADESGFNLPVYNDGTNDHKIIPYAFSTGTNKPVYGFYYDGTGLKCVRILFLNYTVVQINSHKLN